VVDMLESFMDMIRNTPPLGAFKHACTLTTLKRVFLRYKYVSLKVD
jgi:hypothetical protein